MSDQVKVECFGTIGIVSTKLKPCWHKRKAYEIGDKVVKEKRLRKFKKVALKEPYLSGHIELRVNENLVVGGIYVCHESGNKYMCVSKTSEPISNLKICSTHLGKTFTIPKRLTLIMSCVLESSMVLKSDEDNG